MNARREAISLLLFFLVFLFATQQVSAQTLTIGDIRTRNEQGSPVYFVIVNIKLIHLAVKSDPLALV
ncbi:MAG: hypothetical protein GX956_09885 [Firmicutes bacterium]|nr:hypothetical protein [Bacillota bacterium]